MVKLHKEYQKYVQPYVDAGVVRIEERKRRFAVITTEGKVVVCSTSPSDHRAPLNFKSDLKRAAGHLLIINPFLKNKKTH